MTQNIGADVGTFGHAVHPRPTAVVLLLLLDEFQGVGLLVTDGVHLEECGDAAALLGLALGLQHPRRLLQHDGFQVLVLLELREQGIRRLDLPFLDVVQEVRDVVGDVGRERVSVEHVEGGLGAVGADIGQIVLQHLPTPSVSSRIPLQILLPTMEM